MLRTSVAVIFLFFISLNMNSQSAASTAVPSGGACRGCMQPLDGNHTLGLIYQKDTCGLKYAVVSQKLGQRFTPPGPIQPVTLNISGLPPCMVVEKAFLWCDASGTGVPITATIVNPASNTSNIPMTIIGQDVDKCWGYAGTYSYRADVTSAISGNGNYIFSGFPTGNPDDVDGMTMMIIYRDPTVTDEGHIIIYDGAVEITASSTTQSILNLSPCSNSTSANAFMIVADLQNVGTTESMNNSPAFSIADDWWNYVDQPTSQITTGQTQSDFTITTSNDCFNFMMMGLYYTTTSCMTCTANATIVLNVNATASGGCGATTGSVTATASGGQGPYTYTWQPGNLNGATQNNLTAGTYTCTVTDASGCGAGADTVTVTTGNFPVAQFSLTPSPVAFFPGQLCMTDQTVGGTDWLWLVNGVPLDSNSTYCYALPDTGNYCAELVVQNASGCADTATRCVTVLGESLISIPNVFTPNGDNTNDVFQVTWIGLTSLQCDIYDRWGVLIYSWNGLTGGWNGVTSGGKKAVDGVYYYVVNATTTKGENKTLTGFVHLIR